MLNIKNEYKFTNLTHEQIIDIIEKYRIKNELYKSELSRRAGYSDTFVNQIQSGRRFSRKSFNAFMNLCNAANEQTLFATIDKRTQASQSQIEAAIQLLKSTGKYKILELQQTWNEL